MHTRNHGTRNGSQHRFAIGLLCGAAVGAAVGLLLAPRSGVELRGELADSASRLRQKIDDGYQQAAGAVGQVVKDGSEALRRGREAFGRARAEHLEEVSTRG